MADRLATLQEMGWGYQEVAELLEEIKVMLSPYAPGVVQYDDGDLELRQRIHAILVDLALYPHYEGYSYLVTAILINLKTPKATRKLVGEIYKEVASEFGKTANHVNKSIINAIELTWDRANHKVLQKYFVGSYRPTNHEFIAMITEIIRLQLDLR